MLFANKSVLYGQLGSWNGTLSFCFHIHEPECTLDKNETECVTDGILGMKCCVLDPCMLRVHTWCKITGHWSTKAMKEVTSHFFLYAALHPVLFSQLSHSGSEFDQYVKPDTDKAPCNEHERLSKHPSTGAHTLTHANIPPDTPFLLCVSLTQPLISLFWSKGSKTQPPAALHSLSETHSSQYWRRGKCQHKIVCGTSTTLHFSRCQPICLSDKIHEGATFKAKKWERSCLNNESVRGMNYRPVPVWVFANFFQVDEAATIGSVSVRHLRKDELNFSSGK